jgi:hypothetical protein
MIVEEEMQDIESQFENKDEDVLTPVRAMKYL